MDKRQERLLKLACEAFKQPKSTATSLLLNRLQRNETQGSILTFASKWRNKHLRKTSQQHCDADQDALNKRKRRLLDFNKDKLREQRNAVQLIEEEYEKPKMLDVFRKAVRRVRILNRVVHKLREWMIEKGGHQDISMNTMQLKDIVTENGEQENLLFNVNDYKSQHQCYFPKWAKDVCWKQPEDRSQEELKSLVSVMRQLNDFRKYSRKMQLLLAKIVRYESFGRRRVIIRKGHLGASFYIIFSGSVGVVLSVDGNIAFDEEPANIMVKGDSFGELALVRRSVRAATVVCMEFTEFMVIDKYDFFKLGIARFAEEEMLYRMKYLRTLDLFSSWEDENLKEVAGSGRNIEVLSSRVVEEDTTESEYIYVVVKHYSLSHKQTQGHCDVIRLLDLTMQEFDASSPWNHIKRSMCVSPPPSHYFSSFIDDSGSSISHITKYDTPSYDASNSSSSTIQEITQRKKNSSKVKARLKFSRNTQSKKQQKNKGIYLSSRIQSMTSNQSSETPTTNVRKIPLEFYASVMKKKEPPLPEVTTHKVENSYEKSIRNSSLKANLGLGAYIRVDVLCQGDTFGMNYVLKEEERNSDTRRKFTLLSAGCEVIRIPKANIRRYTDVVTLEKIKATSTLYLSDGELYQIFKRYHNWRSFREKLVDHITSYKSSIGKSTKDRCATIPRVPRINNDYSNAESPIKHWQMLAESGQIEHSGKGPNSSWCVSPTLCRPKTAVNNSSETTPFKQERILTARGSRRALVLTHGGDRVNRLQTTTKSSLLRAKANTKHLIASYS